MATTYDSSRILLPDYLRKRQIEKKWNAYQPVFLTSGMHAGVNIISGDQGVENIATNPTKTLTGLGGRYLYTGDVNNRCGLTWPYNTYVTGSTFTIFFVTSYASTTPASNRPIVADGTTLGPDRYNYYIRNKNATTEMVFSHQNASGADTFNTGLFVKDNEPSTVSFSINDTQAEACVDGKTATSTFTYTPSDPEKGNFTLMYNAGGSAISSDASIYLLVIFAGFISNEAIQELHQKPSSLFADTSKSYVFPAVATTGAGLLNGNKLNRMRLIG